MDLSIYSFLTNFLNRKANKIVGQIVPVVCMDDYIPEGTLPCNGQSYNKQDYLILWNKYLIGTKTKYYAWVSSAPSLIVWTKTQTPISQETPVLFGSTKYTDSRYSITNVGSETQITVTLNDNGVLTNYICVRQSSLDEKDHLLPTCTETAYTTFLADFGQCPVWTVNISDGTFRTPHIKDGAVLQQAMNGSELGKAYNAGLPNIEFQKTAGFLSGGQNLGGGNNYVSDYFRASDYNPIYGNSETVQPQAITTRFFVVI